MAKKKVSLDVSKIKGFFGKHIEKMVFAACVAMLLLLVYKGFTRQGYDRRPTDVANKATEKEQLLQQATWNEEVAETADLTVPKLDEQIAASRTPVAATEYSIQPFNEPVFETRVKRAAPTVLPPEKLEVASDLAAFVIAREPTEAPVTSLAGATEPSEDGYGVSGKGGGAMSKGKGGEGGEGGMMMRSPQGGMAGRVRSGPPGGGLGGRFGNMGGQLAQATVDTGFPVAPGQKRVAKGVAIVKALVPVKKQRTAYNNLYLKSVLADPSRDEPDYVGIFVERQEVGGDTDAKPVEIQSTSWSKIEARLAKDGVNFAGYAPELADPAVVHPRLTHPLGPKAESGWEISKVVHSQLIPAASELPAEEAAPAEGQPPAEGGTPQEKEDPFAQDPGAAPGGQGFRQPGRPLGGGGMGKGGGGAFMQRPGGMGGGKGGSGMGGGWNPSAAAAADTEYYLIRFFDFDVEPGKSYRYRVKLAVRNPNQGLAVKYLDSPELAKDPYIFSEWSEQSGSISIPRESYLLVGDATRGTATIEPQLTMIGVRMVADIGVKAPALQARQVRGQLLNWRGQKAPFPPEEPEPFSTALPGENPDKPEKKKPKKERDKTVDILTETLLIDIRGGDSLGKLRDPGEALVMTPSGRLVVKSQVSDADEYQLHDQKIRDWKDQRNQKDEGEEPARFGPPGLGGKGGGKG